MQAKTLLLDIETAPNIAYVWRMWQEVTSMDLIAEDWYILCWCAKWLHNDKMYKFALPDFPLYESKPTNDVEILQPLWTLMNEADIIVGHNAARFDLKKINTRMILHKMPPPSPYKITDTLKVARRHFSFTSNKLNDLGKLLHLGEKEQTGGFKLWSDCLAGKKAAWKKMVSYCAQDVNLLEKVYLTLLPYASGTPNVSLYMDEQACPKCGSHDIERRGFAYTNLSKFQRFHCKACGSWSRDRSRIKPSEELLSNI